MIGHKRFKNFDLRKVPQPRLLILQIRHGEYTLFEALVYFGHRA